MNFTKKYLAHCLIIGCTVVPATTNAQSFNWNENSWNESNWQSGGNTDYLDTDGDRLLNRDDTDDDNDGLSDEIEIAYGLDPLNADDADEDADGDGLTNAEEIALGTDLFDNDSDNDGVPDGLDNDPLVANAPNDVVYSEVFALPDINMDGGLDYAHVSVVNGEVRARIATFNGVDGTAIDTFIPDTALTGISALRFPDLNTDDIGELALFGLRNDEGNVGRAQMVVVDPMTGDVLRTYNWPASWDEVSPLLLDDMTGDGVDEVAIQGLNSSNGRPQLVVRNGATGGAVETFSFPDLFSNGQWIQLSDVTGDGVDDIGLVGNRRGNGKMQVRVVDATDRTNRPRSYNFGPKWDDTQFVRLSDTDGEGTDDWGMYGVRQDDGRPQLINKKGHEARGVLRIHAWPGDMSNATFHRMPDMTGDGIDDVAVVGLRSNNRYQFNIKDGADRSGSVANLGWPNNWDEVSFEVMDDLTGDDIVEVALFGQNRATGQWELVVKDGSTRLEVHRYSLGDGWDEKPQVMMLGDVSGDNVPDFLVYGSEDDAVSVQRYSGADSIGL